MSKIQCHPLGQSWAWDAAVFRFLILLSVSLLPHPTHYLPSILLGCWQLWLTQAPQVCLAKLSA